MRSELVERKRWIREARILRAAVIGVICKFISGL